MTVFVLKFLYFSAIVLAVVSVFLQIRAFQKKNYEKAYVLGLIEPICLFTAIVLYSFFK